MVEEKLKKAGESDDTLPPEYRITETQKKVRESFSLTDKFSYKLTETIIASDSPDRRQQRTNPKLFPINR